MTFSPITTLTATTMHTSVGLVGDLTALFPIVYIIVAIPSGIWLDKHFTSALTVGAVLTGLAGIARVLFPVSYTWQFGMQLLLAAGQPFVINAMASFARRYFPTKRRPAAIATVSVALFMGIVVAMIVSPILAKHGGLKAVELFEGLPALIIMLWILLGITGPFRTPVFNTSSEVQHGMPEPSASPSSASPVASSTSSLAAPSVLASLRAVLQDRFVWLLCGLLSVGLGVFDALNTWLQPIFAQYGIGGASGTLLALMAVAGIIGSAILPSYAAARNRRKLIMILAIGLATWMFIAIMIFQSVVWIGAWMVLDGFFLLAGFPIIMEWTEHRVATGLQGVAVGFIMLTSHLGGIVLIFLIQVTLSPPYLALAILALASALGLWLTTRLPGRQEQQSVSQGRSLS